MRRYCQFCGTPFEGERCPACGAVHRESDIPGSDPVADASTMSKTAPAERPGVWPIPVLKAARRFLWGLIVFALCISGNSLHRDPNCREQLTENLEQFVRCRTEIVYLWEVSDGAGDDGWLNNLSENIPQFLVLGKNNLIIPLEEVVQLWLIP